MWLIIWFINLKIYGRQKAEFSLKKKKSKTERQNIQLYIPVKRCPDPLYPAQEISLHKWVTIS